MRTRDDIFTQVLVRGNRTTTDGFITDAILRGWYGDAVLWASTQHPWPMLKGRASTTFTTEEIPYFEGWLTNSTEFIQINGKRYQKINFEDYKIFREEQVNSNERVFSDFARVYYVNPNGTSGTLVAYGQYIPAIDVSDESGITPFSDYDSEGNEAIVEKMLANLKRREHLAQEAEMHDQRADTKLTEVWSRIADKGPTYHGNDRGMFKRLDIATGRPIDDVIKRDQF